MTTPGRRFGRYVLVREIGRGGNAQVWEARDEALERRVAVKLLLGALDSSGAGAQRLALEAKVCGALDHPNIVPIFDFGTEEETIFVVMPFLASGTLSSRIHEAYVLSDVLFWLQEAASALDFANRHGVVHRDVKPANFLFGNDGRLMLADFGIARIIEADSSLTATGVGIGTPGYMAPEQMAGGTISGATDQYALGCLAYRLLTGTMPYDGKSSWEIIAKKLNETFPPASSLNGTLSPAVDAVFDRVLAKDSTDRFASASAFVSAMRHALTPELSPAISPAISPQRSAREAGTTDRLASSRRDDTGPLPDSQTFIHTSPADSFSAQGRARSTPLPEPSTALDLKTGPSVPAGPKPPPVVLVTNTKPSLGPTRIPSNRTWLFASLLVALGAVALASAFYLVKGSNGPGKDNAGVTRRLEPTPAPVGNSAPLDPIPGTEAPAMMAPSPVGVAGGTATPTEPPPGLSSALAPPSPSVTYTTMATVTQGGPASKGGSSGAGNGDPSPAGPQNKTTVGTSGGRPIAPPRGTTAVARGTEGTEDVCILTETAPRAKENDPGGIAILGGDTIPEDSDVQILLEFRTEKGPNGEANVFAILAHESEELVAGDSITILGVPGLDGTRINRKVRPGEQAWMHVGRISAGALQARGTASIRHGGRAHVVGLRVTKCTGTPRIGQR